MTTTPIPSTFLLAILEGFLDGILVITDQKQLLYINHSAQHLCHRFNPDTTTTTIPQSIWQACEALIESQSLYPEKLVVMETEVDCGEIMLRVRVQWLTLAECDRPCLLVRLQDQQQATQTLAIAEAQNWHLTERETQVWLLRRAGLSRKQIASELYISEDTVKKHLGNVRAKRQCCLDEEVWQQQYSQSPKVLRSA